MMQTANMEELRRYHKNNNYLHGSYS